MKQEVKVLHDSSLDLWDEFVSSHPDGTVYHTSYWKRILELTFKHITAFIIVIEENKKIVAGIPFYIVRSGVLGNRIVSIPYANISNPLISTPDQFSTVFNTVKEYASRNKCNKIILHSVGHDQFLDQESIFSQVTDKHHFIPVSDKPDLLLKRFHRSCVRQQINKLKTSGIELEDSKEIDSIDVFYSLFVKTRKSKGLPPIPKRFFLSMWRELKPLNYFHVFLVKYRDIFIGAAIILKFRDMVHLDFLADLKDYRFCNTSHFLYWETINLAFNEKFSGVSLGRTSTDNKTLLDFKRRWGSYETDMLTHIYPKQNNDNLQKEQSAKYKLITTVSKHLPDPVFVGLGELLYKHMG